MATKYAETHGSRPHLLVIGSGPVGLETAVAAIAQGWRVTLVERGAQPAQNVRDWGHVQLFSPWQLNTSERGRNALAELQLPLPQSDAFPTGLELAEQYLAGLASWVEAHELGTVRTSTRVISIGRCNVLKGTMGSATRRANPFRTLVSSLEGQEEYVTSQALVDASGTYGNYNHSGAAGLPALGESTASRTGRIIRVVPDPLGVDRERFSKAARVVILGSGYSAVTTLNALVKLQAKLRDAGAPAPELTWLTRRTGVPFELVAEDSLPQRDALAKRGNEWAQADGSSGVLRIGGVQLARIESTDSGLTLHLEVSGSDQVMEIETDFLVSNCGYRPDNSLYRELQVHQCYATEGPMNLAAAMMAAQGGGADCLKQVVPGAQTLLNPEPGFLILGMKSYGRGSKFIMRVGHDQVEHAMSLLTAYLSES